MRILLVTDRNRDHGGAEAHIVLLRDRLRAAGDEVRFLTNRASTLPNDTADYIVPSNEHVLAQAFLQIDNPFAAACARHAGAEFKPDVVMVNMFARHLSPAIFRAFKKFPVVLVVSDYKCVCPIGTKLLPNDSICRRPEGLICYRSGCVGALHWLRDQPRYALIDAAVRGVDRVIACSETIQQELGRNGIFSEVIYLASPAPSPHFDRHPAADPLFLYCGRLDREKGVELLLRAFARLYREVSNARLCVAGRGAARRHLEKLASDLGLTNAVEFCGWLSPAQVEEKLRDPWAVIVPSLWAEPLGLIAIEAIVRGVPVIASAESGLAEIVEQGVSGLLFPKNDEPALFANLRAVARREQFADHDLPNDVVARTRARFDVDLHVARMRSVFAEVISKRAAKSSSERRG